MTGAIGPRVEIESEDLCVITPASTPTMNVHSIEAVCSTIIIIVQPQYEFNSAEVLLGEGSRLNKKVYVDIEGTA